MRHRRALFQGSFARIDVELFFQQFLNGLTVGGVYSLVALGLTLVYGILQLQKKIRRTGTVLRG